MAQTINQGNIFGRIGTGIGKGLAEQGQKEIEHQRLSSGLKELGKKSADLSPTEFLTEAYSTYGITPQMVQSLGEAAKYQRQRNAFSRGNNYQPKEQYETDQSPKASADLRDFQSSNILDQAYKTGNTSPGSQAGIGRNMKEGQLVPSDLPRLEEAKGSPGAANENPLSDKYIPTSPWNQFKQENAINEAFDRGIATTFEEASNYANQQKDLYENSPKKYQEQLDYKKGIDKEVDDKFDQDLQTRLQKKGEETFNDVPGDLQLNLKKQARNAVATGKMNPQQAAEYYSKTALDLVKDRNRILEMANRDVGDRIVPKKKEETLKNLNTLAKRFYDSGNSEYFYNLMVSDKTDDSGRQIGMGLSPGAAALIAYPRTEKVKKLINNTKISYKNSAESTRNFAENLFKDMTPKDSFLAIARQMKDQDPNFDEYAFIDYLRENADQYGSNPRLQREVDKGASDIFPNWRDIGLFPIFGKSVAND